MAKGWRKYDFDASLQDIGDVLGTSLQNAGDAQKTGMAKVKVYFESIYTEKEIAEFFRYIDNRR